MHSFSFITLVLACALGTSAASTSSRRSIAFFQQNGPAAKDLNDKYGSLTVNSTCNNGDIACIGGQFASCWGSSYHVHGCPDGWVCAAIPNERSEGTTTTCVSPKDIAWRFTQAGVSETKRFASLPGARSQKYQYLQENGPAAQALNDKYESLTVSSPCSDGDIACINGQFASCRDDSYHVYGCPDGWACAAIPNEWSSGTTTTCDSPDNIAWRFAQAGVPESKRCA